MSIKIVNLDQEEVEEKADPEQSQYHLGLLLGKTGFYQCILHSAAILVKDHMCLFRKEH